MKTRYFLPITLAILLTPLNFAFPFAYVFANETNGIDLINHPVGYDGNGGVLTVRVKIDPTSANADRMVIPIQNALEVWNNLANANPNFFFQTSPPASGEVDFESVLIHELGHCLGLAHCNLGNESGLEGVSQDYTRTLRGPDETFSINPGPDGIIGSADDIRGDDINMNYFKIVDNNPFELATVVDQTTYSRNLNDLSNGDRFSVNADRNVGVALGFTGSEAIMQQGTFSSEEQRILGADDVAGLRYGMSGFDEIEGTADDYTVVLEYVDMNQPADIIIDFDDSRTSLAVAALGAILFGNDHSSITDSQIFFNSTVNWYFNDNTLSNNSNLAQALGLSIYPNPVSNVVTIANPKLVKLKTINIYDINGRLIKLINIGENVKNYKTNINISEFNTGVYIFEINSTLGKEIKQIIKN